MWQIQNVLMRIRVREEGLKINVTEEGRDSGSELGSDLDLDLDLDLDTDRAK